MFWELIYKRESNPGACQDQNVCATRSPTVALWKWRFDQTPGQVLRSHCVLLCCEYDRSTVQSDRLFICVHVVPIWKAFSTLV